MVYIKQYMHFISTKNDGKSIELMKYVNTGVELIYTVICTENYVADDRVFGWGKTKTP